MRRPLKYQLLLPWLAVTLATVLALSITGAWLASNRVRNDLQANLRNSARTLVEANFPIEDSVLRQASGLSGATFIAVNEAGQIRAASQADIELPAKSPPLTTAADLELSQTAQLDGETYFHAVVDLDRRRVGGRREQLHVFYPERQLREARWQAVWPPLLAGGIATALLMVVTTAMASRVTRPIEQLGQHAENIAKGEFEPIAVPERNDELRDLVLAINRMTEMLARYEDEVRRNERLSTLGQLGGGIAHQIRNAVTGCRMALDLHRSECTSKGEGTETLDVATRQLVLMERYIQRFLTLGHPAEQVRERFDLRHAIEQTLPLVKPSAQHVGVQLALELPQQAVEVVGDLQAIEQALVNLVLNAVEAASARVTAPPAMESSGQVTIRLHGDATSVWIDVVDNGPGVSEAVRRRLFEPFATDKADGVGLGLTTARDLVRSQGGEVELLDETDATCFRMRLPLAE
jgi:signal transduction histidine kinase